MGSGPANDPYALLGLEPGASPAELRRAWRRLALEWHPDRAGPGATGRFQAISAAYAVLSDPVARAAYDRRSGAPARRPAARGGPADPAAPAAPRASAAPRRRAPGVMLQRLTGSLPTLLASGAARRAEGGIIEVVVNPEEAAQGGMLSISMRVKIRCAACTGDDAACARCEGRGSTDELYSAWLAVPPEVADGTMLTPSALLRGMLRPVSFRVRLRAAR